ncbi:FxsA family protein [Shewanella algae]|uniref:FxsA family protein n=1 Tax=Shewanella algae TaxID=38313 RepID=UPI001F195767|nr:FxsA family protein [Shewanella algae]MCE9780965.1 FxsA family protein [Shewanella algae]MCE9824866.1 FxsA family protein [Shewanella algae]
MPFLIMFIIFVLIPVVELSVLIRVGEVLGSWNTVALVILTAVVGVSLVRSQGLSTLMSVQKKLAAGEAPGQEIVEGMMLAMAGILLLIPGFVTDLIGLILLTPITRAPLARYFYQRMQLKVVAGAQFRAGTNPFEPPHQRSQGGDVFEGEFERKADPSDKRPESHQLGGESPQRGENGHQLEEDSPQRGENGPQSQDSENQDDDRPGSR